MNIIAKPEDMQRWSECLRLSGKRIGFVPTMGYLHQGHLSLVSVARQEGKSDQVVMSIFVNPAQFAPNEDFDRYPRNFERDCQLAESAGVDVIFHPAPTDMYSSSYRTYIEVEEMGKRLCGRTRPTHFRGVTTIVGKLFNIVKPHVAVFGQKDAQQFLIIRRMVQDLNFDVELIGAPIVREPDGLAMSSRNQYLNPAERAEAVCLYQALQEAKSAIEAGKKRSAEIMEIMKSQIQQKKNAQIDYIEIVNAETLEPVTDVTSGTLIALAVYIGRTRLIDNLII